MCGIVGFTGNHQAAPILLDGLSKLEYRGYDSAGLAVRDGEHLAQVVKAKGRLSNLSEKTDSGKALKELAVSVIHAGRLTVSQVRSMHIRMYPETVREVDPVQLRLRLSEYITVLSKTIQS